MKNNCSTLAGIAPATGHSARCSFFKAGSKVVHAFNFYFLELIFGVQIEYFSIYL